MDLNKFARDCRVMDTAELLLTELALRRAQVLQAEYEDPSDWAHTRDALKIVRDEVLLRGRQMRLW